MPAEDRKPAWRAACLAYREKRRGGGQRQARPAQQRASVAPISPIRPGATMADVMRCAGLDADLVTSLSRYFPAEHISRSVQESHARQAAPW
jgi:hypothetical protein